MYSLYRAWFGDSVTPDNYSRLQETLSPPDTVVRVGNEGEHQFVAHKGVLAAHSGYLKALLTSAAATTPSSSNQAGVNANITSCANMPATAIAVTTTNFSGQSTATRQQPVTSVSVSSIGGEAFAPLLNYMYTGRLEVTLDNVYSVLLATHLLHMPGALEQCRAALLRLRAPPPLPTPIPVAPTSTLTSTSMPTTSGTGNILRPIPNRLMIDPSMCWPPTASLYPSVSAPAATSAIGIPHLPQLQPSVIMQSAVPLGVSVVPASNVQETQTSYREVSPPKSSLFQIERNHRGHVRVDRRPQSPENVSSSSLPFVAAATAAFTAFTAANVASTRTSSPCQSISPTPSSVTSQSSSVPRSTCESKKPTTTEQQQRRQQPSSKEEHDYERPSSGNNQTQQTTRRSSPSLTPCGTEDGTTTTTTTTRNHERNVESSTLIGENDHRARSSRRRGRGSNNNNNNNNNNNDDDSSSNVLSVVYDIACCDGPVKFHRVLNENYSSSTTASCGVVASTATATAVAQSRLQRPCFLESGNLASSGENDENGGPTAVRIAPRCDQIESSVIDGDNNSNNGSYTCGYCRHTFKSQYCYRKHTKRHLLPTRATDTIGGNRPRMQDTGGRNRREVRLLDLNVQYYPCKICGCKFPSYYFVHKHRKLCHANTTDERMQSDEANSTANEDQESTTSTTNNERK